MSRNKITDLTPFVFEDGDVYYFQIFTFPTGNYHDLFVYEKKKFFVKKWFFKKEVVEKLVQVGSSKLIKIDIGVDDLKSEICSIIRSTKPKVIDGWDGFVGEIPDDLKKAFIRSSKINDIFS